MLCKFRFAFIFLLWLLAHAEPTKLNYEIRTFNVSLDHFSFAQNKTFSLRYLINDTFVENKNSPILIYTGNEGDIEFFAQNTGFMWKAAKELKASIVFAEHRYYGKSLPFGKDSHKVEHLGYLSTSQALADYAELLIHLNPKTRRPVIAIGGSYGGRLAAWIRNKYPHLVVGALASSAPLRNSPGLSPACDLYNRILTHVFRTALEDSTNRCVENLEHFWDVLE